MQHEHLKQRAQKLGLHGGDLAALANLSAPKMSNFFRGRITLDPVKVKEITSVIDDLERLKEFFPVPLGFHDMKLIAVTIERLRTDKFNSFRRLMKAIDWEETPEGLERKFPRIFKEPKK
jgi:hypothetical protein